MNTHVRLVCPRCGSMQTINQSQSPIKMLPCEACSRNIIAKGECCVLCAYGDARCYAAERREATMVN